MNYSCELVRLTHQGTQSAGNGSKDGGGTAASVGHRFGFGNTEEEYRTLVLGCQEQGRKHFRARSTTPLARGGSSSVTDSTKMTSSARARRSFR